METLGPVWRLFVLLAGLVLLALPSGVNRAVFRVAARTPSHPVTRTPLPEQAEDPLQKMRLLCKLEDQKLRLEEARLRMHDFRTLLVPQLEQHENSWMLGVITGARFGPGGDLYLVKFADTRGVAEGSGALKGMVAFGTVTEVSGDSAWILPLDVPPSRVPVLLSRSRAEGLLEATRQGLFLRYVRAIDVEPPLVAEGDILLTSGRAGMFPRGIMIGSVRGGIGIAEDGLHYEAEVAAEFRYLAGDVVVVVAKEAEK